MSDKPSAAPTDAQGSTVHKIVNAISETAFWVHDAVLGAPAKTLEPMGLRMSEPQDPPRASFIEYIGADNHLQGRGNNPNSEPSAELVKAWERAAHESLKIHPNADEAHLMQTPQLKSADIEIKRECTEQERAARNEKLLDVPCISTLTISNSPVADEHDYAVIKKSN